MSEIEKIRISNVSDIRKNKDSFISSMVNANVIEDIDLVPDFIDDTINEISATFGSDKLTKGTGLDCLKQNNITGIGSGDILEVVRYGTNLEDIKVTLIDGSQYVFVFNNGEYVFDNVTLIDGTIIQCNLSDITQNAVRDLCGIYDHIEVKGHTTLNVNGVDLKLYWLEDDTKSLHDFIKFISTCREGIECFPNNVLTKVDKNGFKGIFYGAPSSRDDGVATYNKESINWAAYAFSDDFIFYAADNWSKDYVTHEFSHIFDDSLETGEGIKFSHYDSEFFKLYEQYKKIIQPLEINYSGYGNMEEWPDGIPTSTEFFAVVSNIYCNHGEDLQVLIPELYNYLNNFYNNI